MFLDLLPDLEAPLLTGTTSDVKRLVATDTRRLYGTVDAFHRHEPVREACKQAIDRLPRRQGEVVRSLYLDEIEAATLAGATGISRSTVHNHAAQGRANLRQDDRFFLRLHALGIVRDRARKAAVERRYAGGRMPDGRRRVVIEEEAA